MAERGLAETIGGFFAIVAFFSIFGLVAGGFMLRDLERDTSSASAVPHTITLADLLTHGPGDNSHVTITRFDVGRDYVLYSKGSDRFTFMILRPRDPVPKNVQQFLLVENRTQMNVAEADAFRNKQSIVGIYSKQFNSTNRETRQLIEAKYPGLDLSNAPFLDVRQFRGDWYSRRAYLLLETSGAIFLTCGLAAVILFRIGNRNKPKVDSSRTTLGTAGPLAVDWRGRGF